MTRLMRLEMARELGMTPDRMLLNSYDDSRIIATAIALLRAEGWIADVVSGTGESEEFVRRVREVHRKQNAARSWRKDLSPLRVASYVVAASKERLITTADILAMDVTKSTGELYNVVNEYKRSSSRWSSLR
ncbi:MAG: hypothetical protein ACYDB2_02710 [Acidimicrobiales bacterium]